MKRSAFALQSALSRRRRINAASSTLIRRLARSTLLFHSFIASPSSLRALRIHRHGNPLADEMQRSARRQQVLDLSCTNSVELLVKLNVEQLAAADLFSCGRWTASIIVAQTFHTSSLASRLQRRRNDGRFVEGRVFFSVWTNCFTNSSYSQRIISDWPIAHNCGSGGSTFGSVSVCLYQSCSDFTREFFFS